jgi:phosphoenolpyruvate carboxykinase (GTP)
VNWFRKGADGKFLWPGFGENSRVLKWICERVEGTGNAQLTPIGNLPTPDALDLSGLDLPAENLAQLLAVDGAGWRNEADDVYTYHAKFGTSLPMALHEQLGHLRHRLE